MKGRERTITDGGHRDQCPPEPEWNRVEVVVGIGLNPLGVVDKTGKDHNTKDKEENEKNELGGAGFECLY